MRTGLLIIALAVSAAAQNMHVTPVEDHSGSKTIEHAAGTVARLHDSMLDPASFVLDGAFVTKADKHGNVSFCYVYRAHNKMGGYSEGRAVEDGADHDRLSTYNQDDGYGKFPGYDVGWVAPCKKKNIDRDITADVAALAPKLYRKDK